VRHRRHRWIIALFIAVLAFSQVAVAAHACPIVAAAGSASFADEANAPMADCEDMPAPSDAGANVCEAHCLVGQQVQNSDATLAPVALPPPLFVRVPANAAARGVEFSNADPPAGRLPAHVRFNRLLI
jgi:hypothetical protein